MDTNFVIQNTCLSEVKKIIPFCREDKRGAFFKLYNKTLYSNLGLDYSVKELFFTQSVPKTIRAIHFQLEKQQPKIVECVKGSIFDVVVDLNPSSPTYGKWESFELNENNRFALYIPPFHGHGYYVRDYSVVCYMCAEEFYAEGDSGIKWNDPSLGILWPEEIGEPIISDRDNNLMSFREYDKYIRRTVP